MHTHVHIYVCARAPSRPFPAPRPASAAAASFQRLDLGKSGIRRVPGSAESPLPGLVCNIHSPSFQIFNMLFKYLAKTYEVYYILICFV